MKSPHEKALKGYKKGITKGDLLKHKRANIRHRMGHTTPDTKFQKDFFGPSMDRTKERDHS